MPKDAIQQALQRAARSFWASNETDYLNHLTRELDQMVTDMLTAQDVAWMPDGAKRCPQCQGQGWIAHVPSQPQ